MCCCCGRRIFVIKGIWYFLLHKSLWMTSIVPILLTGAFAFTVLVLVLKYALEPQEAFIASFNFFPPTLDWFFAVIFCLIEMCILTLMFTKAIWQKFMDKLFDKVLIEEGHEELVNRDASSDICCRLTFTKIMMGIVTLPLNLIPILGTMAWFNINGVFYAWDIHSHYFDQKGMSFPEQKEYVRENREQYAHFGMWALALEMLPGIGFFFVFTNFVGAALWAAKMEDQEALKYKREQEGGLKWPKPTSFV